ncbi:hypothetical protein ACFIVI_00695 [Oenococcus oeni]|uniref:hypothetical protein n=1 Tax=Oenococcus oeni TaxID=1247 RepID=UPI000277B6EA|nr:hypothetical protein AWRIB553_216 [Oenococcus oeni AWRIB553]
MENITTIQKRISVSDVSILFLFSAFTCIAIMSDNNFVATPWWSLNSLNILIIFTILALSINLISYNVSTKEYFLAIFLFLLAFVTTYTTKNSTCALDLAWIFILRKVNIKQFIWTILITNLILFFLTWLSYRMGSTLDFTNSVSGKHSLGFGNPNTLGQVAAVLIITSLILQMIKGINNISLFSLNLFALGLLYVSGSRGALVISFCAYIVYGALRKNFLPERNQRILIFFYLFSLIFIVIFSFYSTGESVYTSGSFLNILDKIFTNRIGLNNYFMNQYGLSWFGQRVDYSYGSSIGLDVQYAVLDNGILKSFINYGILYTLSIFFLSYLLCKRMIRFEQNWILVPLVSFCFYGFVEQGFNSFWVNFTIGLLGSVFNTKPVFLKQLPTQKDGK